MRKVAIITLFDPENYGNRLQAYALAKTIENLNCQPAEVYYCNGVVSRLKGLVKTTPALRMFIELFLSVMIQDKGGIGNYRRVALFLNFIRRSGVKHIPSNDPSIDYFVCGSDQIWNPHLGGTPFYFAGFAPKEKSIAYAASFGITDIPAEFVEEYSRCLNDMEYISVREYAGAELVRNFTQREVPVVVDPTLLISKDEWHGMARKPKYPVKSRYLLTYFLGWHSEDIDEYIQNVSEKYGLQIVSLNNMHKDRYWFGTGPAEFLWLIENASLVCTNSFHATVFSIIMNTPFINFKREANVSGMSSRIDTLLNTMRLGDRVYEKVKEECLFDVDYRHVSEILEAEKQQAIGYLKRALNLDSTM